MSTSDETTTIQTLTAELDQVESELAAAVEAQRDAQQAVQTLTTQRDAVRTVLDRLQPVVDPESPETTTDAVETFGPTALAIQLAAAGGGELRVADLSSELMKSGRYQDRKRAYSTAHAVLRQSSRFERSGAGKFSDREFGTGASETP